MLRKQNTAIAMEIGPKTLDTPVHSNKQVLLARALAATHKIFPLFLL